MMSFLSDWWEAFVISGCYEMGDPLAPSEVEGNREGASESKKRYRDRINMDSDKIGLLSKKVHIFRKHPFFFKEKEFRKNRLMCQ
jgi:hypothetical protein